MVVEVGENDIADVAACKCNNMYHTDCCIVAGFLLILQSEY